MWFVAAVILCTLSVLASAGLTYCGARMCSYTNAHTFCQFPAGPGPQCIGYVEAPLTTEEKIKLVIRLNQRRAAVASGRLKGFPTAGNMMKLIWMEELAREAQLWADQCEPPSTPEKNDSCRDLYSVAIGQCVASVIGEAPGLRPESMVDIWYMQNMFYKGNVTSYDAPVNNRYNYYGDFAQLVFSKTYMVGCGRSRFMVLISGRLRSVERLVCNFAPRGPNAGRPLWTVASPGSACPPRSLPDDNVRSLCTVKHDLDESQDEENLMSLEEHILLETVFEIEQNESLNEIGTLDEIFLTKVAVATIADVVTAPIEIITLQNKAFFVESIEKDNKKAEVRNKEAISRQSYKRKSKPILVGRPKSYNIEELRINEDNEELNQDNPDTQMQDLPIKEKQFDVDYEFNESREQRRTVSMEKAAMDISISTRTSIFETTVPSVYESLVSHESSMTTVSTKSDIIEEFKTVASSKGVTPYTESINSLNDFNNSMGVNDTDALLEEYLSDPETVKRLQEELYRMEQTMSTAPPVSTTLLLSTERADKVRRALGDDVSSQTTPSNQAYLENSTMHYPQLLQMFNDENKSVTNPLMSIVMRYLPFLKKHKSGDTKTYFSHSNRCIDSQCVLIFSLCMSIVL